MIIVGTKQPVKLQVDCGAEINVISKRYIPNVTMEESSMTLHMWNNMTTKTIGKTRLIVRHSENNKTYNIEFQVVKEERTPLIGRKAAEDMKLITVNYDNFRQLNSVSENDILSEFSDVISVDDNSLGTLPGTVHFATDVTVDPKVVSPKPVPIGLKEKLKVKLQNPVKNGVIQDVDEPTDWVYHMIITLKKNNDIRICLDPQALNRALKREVYPLPVIDDVLPELGNAKVFTKIDLQSGYWHCTHDEDSSNMTICVTPFGRYKWLRLLFGLNVSSEMYQERLNMALEGLEGVMCVADDIIVYGTGEDILHGNEDNEQKLQELLLRDERNAYV